MVDKLLILLLILSFPVAAFVTNRFILQDEEAKNEETIAKVDAVLGQLEESIKNKETKPETPPEEQITVSTVFYATESGALLVSGNAPKQNVQLLLSVVPTFQATPTPKEASGSAKKVASSVLGQEVEVRALSVSSSGVFSFEYPLDEDELPLTLELRLEQAQSSKTILYNFEKGSFEQY